MTRSLTRRLVVITAALGTLALGACTSPTGPSGSDEERMSGAYGGSSTRSFSGAYGGSSTMCSGAYGGSSTC